MTLTGKRAVGGLGVALVVAGLAVVGVLLVKGAMNQVRISVNNDSDSTQTVGPREAFETEGVAQHGQLACVVWNAQHHFQCMVIPRAGAIKSAISLSQLVAVRFSRCE
jgi:hypothetical protein